MARKRNTFGCLFYVALILLVLVVFLFNRQRVQEVIEKTGFARLFQKKPEAPVEVVVTPLEQEERPEQQNQPPPQQQPESHEVVVTVETPPKERTAPEEEAEREPQPKVRQSRLFFISVSGTGKINLKGVIRPVEYVDAPLTETLQALLQGPTTSEINQGLISLISPQTRLQTVYVKGDTAYIDFNEAFRFNSLGKDGLDAEVKQVVYTATEFSTVKKVQILIEGQVSRYLGPEGVAIGKPLSRDSFSR
jgi:germination protein M